MNSQKNSDGSKKSLIDDRNSKHHSIILDFSDEENERCIAYPVSSESTFNYSIIGGYLNSCNGLLYFHDNDCEPFICNPTTNECKLLPLSRFYDPPPRFICFRGCTGLGFDSRSNDYKVIRFVDYIFDDEDHDADPREVEYPEDETHVELYSFKNGTWKSITDFPQVFCTHPCVYANGCFHWLSGEYMDVFDFAEETFSTIFLEDISKSLDSALGVVLVERDGCLGVLANNSTCVALWVKTKEGGWSKMFEFDASADLDPLGFSKNGNGEFCYFTTPDGQVWVYDCAANHLEKLQIHLRCSDEAQFISYVESTVSLPWEIITNN